MFFSFLFSFFLNDGYYNRKHLAIKVIPKTPKKLKPLRPKPRTMTVTPMYKVVSRNNPLQNCFSFLWKELYTSYFYTPTYSF